MGLREKVSVFGVAMFAGLANPHCGNCLAQSVQSASDLQNEVLITDLARPVCPPVARAAHISGDANLMLHLKEGGDIESAAIVSGPQLLRPAALESVQKSKFKCAGCGEAGRSYSLTYSFQLIESGCCAPSPPLGDNGQSSEQPVPSVIQSGNHVTLVAEALCICDPAEVSKVRSIKCLYLWRCGTS
jgi:hypothetical protein